MAQTKKKKKQKKKKQHRFFWFMIKLQIFLMILVLGGLGYYYFGGYAKTVQELQIEALKMVSESNEETFVPARTSSIYDSNGTLITELSGEKKAQYVKYEDIPPEFVSAMISIEDKKFYNHKGVDYKAFFRAAKAIIQDRKISQGGSTITMQLARTIYLDTGKYWQRKVTEIFIALELEKRYSKEKIMEFYLNNIYFSNGYYGIASACKGYFDCELKDLSLSQIAFLCAIPNGPSYYDPIAHKDHTLERRDLILKNLYEDGKISLERYKEAVFEEIELNVPKVDKSRFKHNSVDTYAYYCATRALMESEGFEFKYYFDSEEEEKTYDSEYDEMYAYCQKKLYKNGYKIYTTIDLKKQKELQSAVDDALEDFKEKGDDGMYSMQGAAVSIDNETGFVVAIVGGRSQSFTGYTLNRAYQSHRQPGSSIKPLIVYTPSFERGYTPDSKVNDHKFEGGPSNAGGAYYGKVNVRFAVEKSLNTVAWQLYEELTPQVGLQYLKNMNFSNIVDSDYVIPTALGGFTTGVSPLEMASAYATLENDGLYRQPTCIKSIIDADENVVYEPEQMEEVIYTETASRMMTDVMTGVMTNGTGRSVNLSNMPCAGKTGTTNDHKDGWFCGYTRYYTTCVWVGYDIPKKVEGLTGSSYPGQIWKQYMEAIHKDLKPMKFLPYAQLSQEFKDQQEKQEEEEVEEEEEVTDDVPEEEPQPEEKPKENKPETPETPQPSQTPEQTNPQPETPSDAEEQPEQPDQTTPGEQPETPETPPITEDQPVEDAEQ